jgi:enoyl-CoA hydratase
MSTLAVTRDDAVATLTLNRPDKLNALSEALLSELLSAVIELDRDRAVRAVIVTGAGDRAFAAGADVAAMSEMTAVQARQFAELGQRLGVAIEQAHMPFIAAINGFALGGGCELAMCCDILYASDKAKLGQPEVNLGILPGFGGTQRLARRVGVGRAREMCMTGEMITAEQALGVGLIDAVVPHTDLLPRVRHLAQKIASKAPLAIALIKRAIERGRDVPPSIATEIELACFASLFGTDDQREGMRAFLEKREPAFRGT